LTIGKYSQQLVNHPQNEIGNGFAIFRKAYHPMTTVEKMHVVLMETERIKLLDEFLDANEMSPSNKARDRLLLLTMVIESAVIDKMLHKSTHEGELKTLMSLADGYAQAVRSNINGAMSVHVDTSRKALEDTLRMALATSNADLANKLFVQHRDPEDWMAKMLDDIMTTLMMDKNTAYREIVPKIQRMVRDASLMQDDSDNWKAMVTLLNNFSTSWLKGWPDDATQSQIGTAARQFVRNQVTGLTAIVTYLDRIAGTSWREDALNGEHIGNKVVEFIHSRYETANDMSTVLDSQDNEERHVTFMIEARRIAKQAYEMGFEHADDLARVTR
jgi:hypothetical protein